MTGEDMERIARKLYRLYHETTDPEMKEELKQIMTEYHLELDRIDRDFSRGTI
jgi:division protein CdvB (Snf7/Vps24/ESCRT-III family)